MNYLIKSFCCSLILLFSISIYGQKSVDINVKSSDTEVYVDGELVTSNTHKVEKSSKSVYQVRLEKPGYKTQYEALSYKLRYEYEILNKETTRKENQRYLRVTETPFNIQEEQFIYTSIPWYAYKADMKDGKLDSYSEFYDHPVKEEIKIEDSRFSGPLNEMLKRLGYLDTVSTFYSLKYNTIDVTGSLYSIYLYHVRENYYQSFSQADLAVEWTITNALNDTLFTIELEGISGKYLFDERKINTDLTSEDIDAKPEFDISKEHADYYAMQDAYENSLLKLISDPVVQKLLDENLKVEDIEPNAILEPTQTVADLEQALKASVTVKVDDGHGSGFFVNNEGYVLTNYHVIHDSKKVEILIDGTKHLAEIVKYSKLADLALLKTEIQNEFSFSISSEKVSKMGQEIFAIGTPKSIDLPSTLSKGIISGFRESGENQTLIQTDVSINSGNSGGPLISREGTLLGIVNSKMSGWGVEGISFGLAGEQILSNLKLSYEK